MKVTAKYYQGVSQLWIESRLDRGTKSIQKYVIFTVIKLHSWASYFRVLLLS